MNIYEYIPSLDVAAHCEKIGHVFTPLEMAVLIELSKKILKEKITAWKALIADFPDMPILKNNGFKIAIATNKRHYYTVKLLDYTNITTFCDVIHGSDTIKKNNKSTIIRYCLNDLNINLLHKCVYVGDTIHDANAAYACGINFIGVTYGYGFKINEKISINNIGMVNNMNDLLKLLME